MKKILFIAKINQLVKEYNAELSLEYRVQLCGYNAETVMGMMELVNPDLVLISLIGAMDLDTSVYSSIHLQYPDIPVFTIGEKSETKRFVRYYQMGQFENLDRPITPQEVKKNIDKKLADDKDKDDKGKKSGSGSGSIYDGIDMSRSGEDTNSASALDENEGDSLISTDDQMKKHILVVDDNAGTLRSIKTMLESEFTVSVVPSGIKAMAMLGKKRPDLILLDYEMPVVDGRQTLEMIRAEDDFADIPVIFLTSVNDKEHIQAVITLNPEGYLLKPPNRIKLIETIKKVLWK